MWSFKFYTFTYTVRAKRWRALRACMLYDIFTSYLTMDACVIILHFYILIYSVCSITNYVLFNDRYNMVVSLRMLG